QIAEVRDGPSSGPIQLRIDRAEDSAIDRYQVGRKSDLNRMAGQHFQLLFDLRKMPMAAYLISFEPFIGLGELMSAQTAPTGARDAGLRVHDDRIEANQLSLYHRYQSQ